MARYDLDEHARLCDLDDPKQLLALHLRPSEVVSRDYARTRAWARRIYEQGVWAGVRWWSYYDPGWSSIGLWLTGRLTIEEIQPLHLEDPAFLEASRTIVRPIRLRA